MIKAIKQKLYFGTGLDNYLKFVTVLGREVNISSSDITWQELPYYAYISLRRNPKMKVIAHFKDDGENLQKLIEELLLEVIEIKPQLIL